MRRTDILTALGKWVMKNNIKINVFSYGGWSETRLRAVGFNVGYSIPAGDAYEKGMIGIEASKKVECWLIDNEDHPDSPKLIKVSKQNMQLRRIKRLVAAREEILWDIDGTLIVDGRNL